MSPHTVSWTSCSRKKVSVKKDSVEENLKERTLVALRLVQDAIDKALPKELIQHCTEARMSAVSR